MQQLYIEWVNKKVLLCIKGTPFDILGQTIMEKNIKKNAYIDQFAVQ